MFYEVFRKVCTDQFKGRGTGKRGRITRSDFFLKSNITLKKKKNRARITFFTRDDFR